MLDQTTSYVGAMSTLEEDKSSAMSGFEYFAPCYTKDDGDAKSGDLLFLALPVYVALLMQRGKLATGAAP